MTVMAAEAVAGGEAAGGAAAGSAGTLKSRARDRARKTAAAAPGYYQQQAAGIGLPGGSKYQGWILAEFLIAALVVAFAPLASGPKDDKKGPSPYRTGDLGQLAAIGIVYFLLALMSAGERGRLAAWSGALILLAILFRKSVSGELLAEVKPLTGDKKSKDSGGPPADADQA